MEMASNRYNSIANTENYPNPNVTPISVVPVSFAQNNLASVVRDPEQNLIKVLESKHETYEEYLTQWGDWYNWYAGKHISNYIYKHRRERLEDFKMRQKRAYYYNYTGAIVDLLASFVYSKTVARSFFRQDEKLAQQEHIEKNEFWTDCDMRNSSIDIFMQKVFTFTQIWGYVDVVVDLPRTPIEIVNEQQRLDTQVRPYLYYILPDHMLNWEVDDKGEFLWTRWVERMDKQYDPFSPKPPVKICRYTTWTRDAWYIHDVTEARGGKKTVVVFDQGFHDLGIVPVVRFYGKRDILDENTGQSFVEPIGCINVDIANSVSLLTEELRSKVFNILVLEDPDQYGDSEGSSTTGKGIEIGNNNALLWAGQHPPFYLSPSSDPGQFILSFIEKSTEEIYKLATLWTDTGIRESRSGVSYCLAEGTLIDMPRDVLKYPNGIPIENLVGGDPFYVYSRLMGRPTVCLANRAWQSGSHQPVYRIEFTWAAYGRVSSGFIEATANHRFMLRDGYYKSVQELNIGDRLMHFNRSLSGDYAAVTAPGGLFREYEHRFIARSLYGSRFTDDMIVHHLNENKLDNRVENLEIMTQHEHKMHHAHDEALLLRIANGGKKRCGENNGRWLTLREEDIIEALEMHQGKLTHTAAYLGISFITLKRKMALLDISLPYNHRVTSIEFVGYKDVFDLHVPRTHNFVANGIVVHNSYEFNRTNSMLADKAQLMEEGEIKVHRLYTKWLGEEWLGFIDYPDSYDVEVLEQELLTVTQAKNAVRSETFKRELEKRVARKVLNNSTTDVLEKVMGEIDTMPDQEAALLDAQIKQAENQAQQDIAQARVTKAIGNQAAT